MPLAPVLLDWDEDSFLDHWAAQDEKGKGRPEPYESGGWGPASADAMLARDGRVWRRP